MTQQGPNPQTNLIFSIVAPVVALIAVAVIYFTKAQPVAPTPPTPVNVAAAKLPANTVVMSSALPNSGTSSNASGGPGGPGGAGPGGAAGRPSFQNAPGGSGQARGSNKGGGALGAN